MKEWVTYFFKNYFEVLAFSAGLLLLAFMNPESTGGINFCLFEQMGITFCPGDGLGHSISYTFRGDLSNALEANFLGPFALVLLSGRIVQLVYKNHIKNNKIA